ncbi:uncharacterized protein LOC122026702 [Zingiber officinale]|uniref:uncharacterized protein LOC122026702 n=1 Tax=Zingiber officinale TaxID=94328 RepID=UPI001C4BD947|nr:uncharacterized protein LOC122026702 [Zingiber officinale]
MADKLLKDYATSYAQGVRSSITRPPIEANNFEITPAVIHMVQENQFGGGPHEDPNHHLELFYEICGTMKVNGVPPDSVRVLLFRFSLKDRAKQWLNSLPANNISSWEQWNPIKASGKFDVDVVILMLAKLDALAKKFDAMGGNTTNAIACVCDTCGSTNHAQDTCPFGPIQAQMNQLEKCDAIANYNQRQNNPYSNTYNPGWRNHPNFSYRNKQDQGPTHQSHQPGQQGYQSRQQTYQQQQPSQLSRIEKMLEEALLEQKEMKNEIKKLT